MSVRAHLSIIGVCLLLSPDSQAMKSDDPLLSKVMSELALETGSGHNALEWDVDAWLGRDLTKLWIKSAGQYSLSDNETETANVELSVSQAISAYWDIQFGLRHDFEPEFDGRQRSWASFGFIGTAPWFIDVDARLFIGEQSSSQLLLELEREIMLTQRWVITPELDIVINGNSIAERLEGSGLSELEFEIRVGYEANRKFQPFAGLSLKQHLGATRKLVRQSGDDSNELAFLVGLEAWF